jgi:hypothetical protein
MRKAIVTGALALLMSSSIASASSVTVALDGFCNDYTLRISHGTIAALDTPSCGAGFGAGYVGSAKGIGKAAVIGLQDPASPGAQFVFTFSYPFANGGSWTLSDTTDGQHFTQILNGTYTLNAPAGQVLQGSKSATAR